MEAGSSMRIKNLDFNKLTGAENYESWKSNMKSFLRNEDLYNTIAIDSEGNAVEKDEDKLMKAKVKINFMLSEDVRIIVGNLSSALDIWLKLKSLYQENSFWKQLKLLKKLFNVPKLEDCATMDDYLDKAASFVIDLESVNCKLDDEFVGRLMLSGLSANYDVLVRRIEYSGMKITPETVKRKLLVEVAKKEALLASKSNQSLGNCLRGKLIPPITKKRKDCSDSSHHSRHGQVVLVKDIGTVTENIQVKTESSVDNHNEDIFTPVASMDILNDDCLLNIFQYLPRIDAIKMERVCTRWRRISQESWKTVRKLNIMEEFKYQPITVKSVEEVLRRGGKFITELYFVGIKNTDLPARAFMGLINIYCTSLTVLHLHYTTWKEKTYLDVLDKNILSNLKSLFVGNHYDFSDRFLLAALSYAVNLEEFGVYNFTYDGLNTVFKGQFLVNFILNLAKSCKKLRIYGDFYRLVYHNLPEILRYHPNIQTLDLSASELDYGRWLDYAKQLTHLALCNMNTPFYVSTGQMEASPRFPNLKTLQLGYSKKSTTALLFFVRNCPELEDLRLRDVQDLKADDFKHIENLKKLKYLDVSSTRISSSALVDIVRDSGKLKSLSCYGCRNVDQIALEEVIEASPELSYLAITSSTISKEVVKSALRSLEKRENNVSLTISLRSKLDHKIPDFVDHLNLESGINYQSKTNILRIACKSNTCLCKVDETCKCYKLDKILKKFG